MCVCVHVRVSIAILSYFDPGCVTLNYCKNAKKNFLVAICSCLWSYNMLLSEVHLGINLRVGEVEFSLSQRGSLP